MKYHRAPRGFIVSGVITVAMLTFFACALTDGTSLMKLKSNENFLPTLEGGADGTVSFKTLPGVGFPYGIGPYQDTYGNVWEDGDSFEDYAATTALTDTLTNRHPAHFFQLHKCDEHQKRGMLLQSAMFIALLASVGGVIAALVGAIHPAGNKCAGIACLVFQIVIFVFSVVGTGAGAAVFHTEFSCTFPSTITATRIVSFDIAMKDHFDMFYCVPFLVFALVLSLANIIVIVATGCLKEEAIREKELEMEDVTKGE